jgi:hypothetical protein
MPDYGTDIYTEAAGDPATLEHLGPLGPMAGVWVGAKGTDEHPVAGGTERDTFTEHYELQPIDRQTNGPQLFYGLRYHLHITKPGEVETFHDQVGYWLWEPATGLIMQTLAIPRGQVLLASGKAGPDDRKISVTAKRGDTAYGICSTDFLEQAFRTDSYRCDITFNDDGSWSYLIQTELFVRGAPFNHHDSNTLKLVAPPKLNPLAVIVNDRTGRDGSAA